MEVFFILFGSYLLSVFFSYYSQRRLLIKRNTEPDELTVLMVFLPFYNLIFSIPAFISSFSKTDKDVLNKFFKLK